jgi:hypothetical protein
MPETKVVPTPTPTRKELLILRDEFLKKFISEAKDALSSQDYPYQAAHDWATGRLREAFPNYEWTDSRGDPSDAALDEEWYDIPEMKTYYQIQWSHFCSLAFYRMARQFKQQQTWE